MSKAVDPFEEYLLKRKVEILEEKFRKQTDHPDVENEEGEDGVPHAEEDPEVAARLKEEMEEFFDAGQSGAAEAFERAPAPEVDDEVVEELKEALDEVFDDDAPPRVDKQDTFVEFFKQVQEDFSDEQPEAALPVPDDSALPAGLEEPTLEDLPAEPEPAPSQEKPVIFDIDEQTATSSDLAPDSLPTLEPAQPAQAPVLSEAPADESRDLELEDTVQDIGAPVDVTALGDGKRPQLDLSEILLPLRDNATEEEMRRHMELLCRLIAKLVDRAALPESEIIEVLIKSRVEF